MYYCLLSGVYKGTYIQSSEHGPLSRAKILEWAPRTCNIESTEVHRSPWYSVGYLCTSNSGRPTTVCIMMMYNRSITFHSISFGDFEIELVACFP